MISKILFPFPGLRRAREESELQREYQTELTFRSAQQTAARKAVVRELEVFAGEYERNNFENFD
jgi:hypothetical protein